MVVMGALGDIIGRKWGSRTAAAIMFSGVILLCFTPFAPNAYGYFGYFIAAQTWYGVGVGTEYPMASGSAAELAEVHPELKAYRGRQVVLTFANQGVGNMFNSLIILVLFNSFNITGYSPPWLGAGDKSLAPVWHYDTSVTQVQSYCFGNAAGTGKFTATFTYCTTDENGYGTLKSGTTNECVISTRTICASNPPNLGVLPVNPGSTYGPTAAPVVSATPTLWPVAPPTPAPTFAVPPPSAAPISSTPTFGPTSPSAAPVTAGPTIAPTAVIPSPLISEQPYVPPSAGYIVDPTDPAGKRIITLQLTCPTCSKTIPNYPNGVPATRDQIPRYYPIDVRTHWFSPKELMEGAFPDSKSVNVPFYPAGTWNPNGAGNGLPSIQNLNLFASAPLKDCGGQTIPYVYGTGIVANGCTYGSTSGLSATCSCTTVPPTGTTATTNNGVNPCYRDTQKISATPNSNCMTLGGPFKTFQYKTLTSTVGAVGTTAVNTGFTGTQLPITGGVSVSNFAYYPIWPAIPGAYQLPAARQFMTTDSLSQYNPYQYPGQGTYGTNIAGTSGTTIYVSNSNTLATQPVPIAGPYYSLPNGAQPIDYLTAYYWDNTAQAYTWGAKQALAVMYGVGAILCFIMVFYRFVYLDESKMFDEERRRLEAVALEKGIVLGRGCAARCQAMAACDTQNDPDQQRRNTLAFCLYWPRQFAASWNWFINDFAFYGNKVQQSKFIAVLYTFPGASTPFITPLGLACWTALNSFVALTGYYIAAFLIDKPWYGRKNMQNVGFGGTYILSFRFTQIHFSNHILSPSLSFQILHLPITIFFLSFPHSHVHHLHCHLWPI